MDIKRFQAIEKQLAEQVEATCTTNETLAQLFSHMRITKSKRITTLPPIPTVLSISHTSRIKPGVPNDFNRD
jgi:hypothetical protein